MSLYVKFINNPEKLLIKILANLRNCPINILKKCNEYLPGFLPVQVFCSRDEHHKLKEKLGQKVQMLSF